MAALGALAAGGATLWAAGQQTQVIQGPVGGIQMPPRASAPNQPQPTGTASLSGTVVVAGNGRPLRRATVHISSTAPSYSKTTLTDDRGGFTFTALPAAQYTLSASKGAYLESIYGQKDPGSGRAGTPISLVDGQALDKISLPVARGGVLTGTVVDDFSEPAFGTQVRAMRYVMRNGERSLVDAGFGTADDRGIYRISSLPPGDYIVMAQPRDDGSSAELAKAIDEMAAVAAAKDAIGGRAGGGGAGANVGFSSMTTGANSDAPTSGYAPVYFPGTTAAQAASAVSVGAGEEKTGVDLQLQLVRLGQITGVVTGGDTRTIQSTSIQLIDNQALPGSPVRTARPAQDGKFSFTGVAPGQYTLVAKSGGMMVTFDGSGGQMRVMVSSFRVSSDGPPDPNRPNGPPPTMWATADVAVDGRTPATTALALQPGMAVSGKVVFDGAAAPPADLTQIRLILSPLSALDHRTSTAMGQVSADGTFKIADVVPGTYRITASPPRGWRPRTVDVEGHDALDFGLEVKPGEDAGNVSIVFTDRTTQLSGTLQDSTGQATSDYTIILFPTDPRYWVPNSRRIQSTRPATNGHYSFQNMPAGDYQLIAVTDVDEGQWFDPAFLKQLAGPAMSLTIREGDQKVQDLRVAK